MERVRWKRRSLLAEMTRRPEPVGENRSSRDRRERTTGAEQEQERGENRSRDVSSADTENFYPILTSA